MRAKFFRFFMPFSVKNVAKQERIQLNANNPLTESMGYINTEGM